MDGQTTIDALRKHVSNFRDERNWLKDNTPKNLAISISVEAAELLEHFQWKTDEQIREAAKDRATKNKISDELADVLILCLAFSHLVSHVTVVVMVYVLGLNHVVLCDRECLCKRRNVRDTVAAPFS